MGINQVWKLLSFLLLPALLLIASKDTYGQGTPAVLPKDRTDAIRAIKNTIENVSQEESKVFTTNDKYVRFMIAPLGTTFAVDRAYRNSPQQAATWFLNNWRSLFVDDSLNVRFEVSRINAGKSRNYIHYQQFYSGIEVFGAQINIQINSSGGVFAVLSDIMKNTQELDTGKISLNPNITPLMAEERAIKYLSEENKGIKFETLNTKSQIFDPKVMGWEGEPKLVWHTIVKATNEIPIGKGILVDASNGEIAFYYDLNPTALKRIIYDYNNSTSIYETVFDWQNPDPNYLGSFPEANFAYKYVEDTYNFYKNLHSWQSYDGDDSTIIVHVRYCEDPCDCPYWGAFWSFNNEEIYLGDIKAIDDIIGHEFTHGVTQDPSNSGLYYSPSESGAINESFSDMWGEWIDQKNGVSKTGNDDPGDAWLFAEDDTDIGIYRNMKNPHDENVALQGPMYYEEPNYWSSSNEQHQNGLLGDYLCYLISTGLGDNDKAANLFWECQSNLLNSSSGYKDLGFCLQVAAYNINFTEQQRYIVEDACREVGIYSEVVFEIKDSSGATTAYFDDSGNLFLKGNAYHVYESFYEDPNIDEFVIKNGNYAPLVIETNTGNLFTNGYVYEGQSMSGANGFVIKNNEGNPVAYINPSGSVYLSGHFLNLN